MMIVTDTASDILESEAAELDIRLAPLDIAFGDVHCSRNTPEMLDEFYRLLTTSEEFPKTSQPAPEIWLELFREAQENSEDVLVLAMTSQISGTYESACMAARLSGYDDHIAVVDTRQAIVCQYIVVRYAAAQRDAGKSLSEIVDLMNAFTKRVHVHGIMGTLALPAQRRPHSRIGRHDRQPAQNQADHRHRQRQAGQPRQDERNRGGEKNHLERTRGSRPRPRMARLLPVYER